MEPKARNIKDIAIWDPVAALGILLNIPTIPVLFNATGTFLTFDVSQSPITAPITGTVASRVWINDTRYRCLQPNVFAGSVFKSTYDANLKQAPGVDIRATVHSGPRYILSTDFTPLENFANTIYDMYPMGWPLFKQQSILVELALVQAPPAISPNAPPYIVTVTFRGWQFLDHTLDEISGDDAVNQIRQRWPWVLDPAQLAK